MRWKWGMLCLVLTGWAQAAEHKSGNFEYSVGPEPGFVIERTVPETWDPAAPGASEQRWRSWLFDKQVDRRTGRAATYMDVVYEPKSPSLVSEAGRFQIDFQPDYQKLTIHRVELRRAGQWLDRLRPERISLARRETAFEQDIADGAVTALIVLDDVRADDVVRISYSVVGSNPILAGQFAETAYMGWRNPVLDAYLRVLYDPGTKVKTQRENADVSVAVRQAGDAVEASAHAHAAPAIVDEDSYPVWFQPFPVLRVSTERRWADVVDWALPLYPEVRNLPPDLEAKLADWSKIPERRDRLKAALRSVQDEVRYFGIEVGDSSHKPSLPGDTWKRRYGDCKDKAYLLATLLDRLDVPAAPALVSTQRGRAISDFPPAASVFNHVIVRAELDGKPVWVDPTIPQQGGKPGDYDLSAYGVALPIAAGVSTLESIAPVRDATAGAGVEEHFEAAPDGRNVKLRVETIYQGGSADHARRTIAAERKSDLSRRYADYYRKRYGELTSLGDPQFTDDRDANTFRIVETYAIASPYESEGESKKSIETYAEALQNASALPRSMARSGPLDFSSPGRYYHRIRIDLPESWRAPPEHDEVRYGSSAFGFSRAIAIAAGKVELDYDLQVKAPEVMPADMAAHLEQLRKVRESLSVRLTLLSAKTTLQPKDREKRLKALLQGVAEGEAE